MKSHWFTCGLIVNFFCLVRCCNEAICGSIVSKCLLVRSCNCDMTTPDCIRDCHICLGSLYVDCCSCVEVCPEKGSEIASECQLGDFTEPIPDLFNSLTYFPEEVQREREEWVAETFSVNITKDSQNPVTLTQNCTVAFIHQCTSARKCIDICQSMGASGYRWFYDGCCECIGSTCINYGINESRCRDCRDEVNDVLSDDELDFGEDDISD